MSKLVRREADAISIDTDEQRQYLTFSLGQEMFAVGILHIREIIEYGSVTTVPMMPSFVRGVINLRGSVVPVLDLAARFGRAACKITRRSCIVIVELESEGEQQELGVIVDAVSEVLEIPASEIEPAPAFGAKIRTDFIAGMGKVNDSFVIILNMNNVLAVEEIAMLAQLNDADTRSALAASTQDGEQ